MKTESELKTKTSSSYSGLTKDEETELYLLRLLQLDTRRWLSMDEFNRIVELSKKAFQFPPSYETTK